GLELARAKGAVVACLSTQAFIDELIAAIDGDRVDWWRARYRRATALLLDDIHLLAGKERTQEELFNLFNLFLDQERQLVFTAPTPPGAFQGIEPRIASRLGSGLVAELTEPDRDVRRGVAERLLVQLHQPTEAAGAGRRWCGIGPSRPTACSRSRADGHQGLAQGGLAPRRAPAPGPGAEDGVSLDRRPLELRLHLLRPRPHLLRVDRQPARP